MDQLPALPENWSRALCVAAHPDDIEYGLAAAVARWTSQGKQVAYLLITRGEAGIDGMDPAEAAGLREAEERAGAREVGVEELDFLDYRDGVLEYSLAMRRDITRVIRRFRPDVVLGGGFDVRMVMGMTNQADHRVAGLATLDACRDAGNRWVFTELADEGLEPWGGVRLAGFAGSSTPTHGVDVTGFVDAAVRSLDAHAQYTAGLGDAGFAPSDFLPWAFRQAGPAMGVESAVLIDVHQLAFEGPPPWADDDSP